jgi:hypothetical protein
LHYRFLIFLQFFNIYCIGGDITMDENKVAADIEHKKAEYKKAEDKVAEDKVAIKEGKISACDEKVAAHLADAEHKKAECKKAEDKVAEEKKAEYKKAEDKVAEDKLAIKEGKIAADDEKVAAHLADAEHKKAEYNKVAEEKKLHAEEKKSAGHADRWENEAADKKRVDDKKVEDKKEKVEEKKVEEKTVESVMMKITDRMLLTASPHDPFGNVSLLKAPPTWVSSNPAIVGVIVTNDGFTADLRPVGLGKAVVTFQGVGETSISVPVNVNVVSSLATYAKIKVGSPEPMAHPGH